MLLESCGRKIPQLFFFHPRRVGHNGQIDFCVESILMADSAFTGNALKAIAAGSVFE
jgi:hypothetical protein